MIEIFAQLYPACFKDEVDNNISQCLNDKIKSLKILTKKE